ncbi:MAG: phosphatase PAP2 family protein [Pseudomonadota bacterium]
MAGVHPVVESQTTAFSIRHVAGQAPIDPQDVSEDERTNDQQMKYWADPIRGFIYVADFMKNYSWQTADDKVTLRWGGKTMLTLGRPSIGLLVDQLDFVTEYMDLRPDRGSEVLGQMGSLSGHYAYMLGLTPSRHPKTFELAELAQLLSSHTVAIPKHYLTVRRPDQLDGRLMPMIQTPGHGSFPSGHATQAMAIATVLAALVDEKPDHFPDAAARKALMFKQAERIAQNRTVAGVHYPIDSYAGAFLGREVARIMVASAKARKNRMEKLKEQTYTPTNVDYFYDDFAGMPEGAGEYRVAHSGPMAWLWKKALEEFI